MTTHLLDIQNLVTRFFTPEGIVHAVNGTSLTLEKGESIAIVGESGSGKSVTALSIMGLIPTPPGRVTNGKILFKGEDLLQLSSSAMRRVRGKEIAMIFQDPMTSLNPLLSIGRQMTEMLQLHMQMTMAQAEARAIELLTLVGIPGATERLKDYPHQFFFPYFDMKGSNRR